jgi:ATP-dependent DNA helicase RecQ
MQLLAYFGEEGQDCGYCDVCLDKKKKHLSQSDFEQIKKDILEFLKMQPHTLDFILEHISGYSKEKVNESISILLDENVLKYDDKLRLIICS